MIIFQFQIASILAAQSLKIDAFLLPCPIKYLTQIDCPGCGFQRSFMALVNGNFNESFSLYPPTVFFLVSIASWAIASVLKYDVNAKWFKALYFLTGAAIALNYVYKIVTHQL